jgi:hypothetical protein
VSRNKNTMNLSDGEGTLPMSRPSKAQARCLVWFMYGSFGRRRYSCDVVIVVVCCFLCEAKNSSLSTICRNHNDEAPKPNEAAVRVSTLS